MEEGKKQRHYDIDLVRVICLLCLPLIHVTEFWGIEDSCGGFLQTSFNDAFYYPCFALTSFVAPSFMLAMGISMTLSKKNSPMDFLIRGLFLLLAELLLNAVRYALPGFIGIIFSPNNDVRSSVLYMIAFGMINSDILAFAGLAFIVFALFKKLKLKPWAIFAIALSIYLIHEFAFVELAASKIHNALPEMVSNLFGNFLYIDGNSTFALAQWLIVPAAGYAFASYFLQSNERRLTKAYGIVSLIGIAGSIIALSCVIVLQHRDVLSAFSHNVNGTRFDYVCLLTNLTLCFLILFACHLLYKIRRVRENERWNAFVSDFSKNTNRYYMVQWVFVGFVMFLCGGFGLWGSHNTPMFVGIIGIIGITIASYFIAPLLSKIRKKA